MAPWYQWTRALVFALSIIGLPISGMAASDAPNNKDCVATPAQEGVTQFTVTKADDGYVLLLPPGLLKQLPYKAEYKVSLIATDGRSASVVGAGTKDGDNFLNIATSQAFNLPTINRNSLKGLDLAILENGTPATGVSSCGGCPHAENGDLECYELSPTKADCTICWCLSPKKR